jgi:peptide/nickel transport system permease protein
LIRYLARRVLQAVPVLFGISLLAFLLIHFVPGDPVRVMLGNRASDAQVAVLRSQLGLDQPLPNQYVTFVLAAMRFDFGQSVALKAPVNSLILGRAGVTLVLVVYSTLIALAIAVPLAIVSALKANRLPDHAIRTVMMITFTMPGFWLGLLFILVFALNLGWFPVSGVGDSPLSFIWSMTLPSIVVALGFAPILIRTMRSGMLASMGADYAEAARARGLSDARVLWRYVLRTSLIATVTIVGVNTGFLLSGAVVIEKVFALPGLGSLLVDSVAVRDFPVVVGLTVVFGVGVIIVNLVTDLANAAVDPRIRL